MERYKTTLADGSSGDEFFESGNQASPPSYRRAGIAESDALGPETGVLSEPR